MLRNSPNTLDLTLKYPTHHLFHFCGGVGLDVAGVGVDLEAEQIVGATAVTQARNN